LNCQYFLVLSRQIEKIFSDNQEVRGYYKTPQKMEGFTINSFRTQQDENIFRAPSKLIDFSMKFF